MTTINKAAVEAVLRGGAKTDRPARIAELEKQLEKVRKDIAEQEKVENYWRTFNGAFAKLKAKLFKTLTPEERACMDGAYLFLHAGCVDLVRSLPSATDKGEGNQFLDKVEMGEALAELGNLIK
ncbi:MAG: hypothetical protein ABR958_01685 [Dehalococcoidales bacterium]